MWQRSSVGVLWIGVELVGGHSNLDIFEYEQAGKTSDIAASRKLSQKQVLKVSKALEKLDYRGGDEPPRTGFIARLANVSD